MRFGILDPATPGPASYACGPTVQRDNVIAADIESLGAVQPQIEEIGGNIGESCLSRSPAIPLPLGVRRRFA
jgi:hypothetical protein